MNWHLADKTTYGANVRGEPTAFGNGEIIAKCWRQKDARLMAAAPDLLEALAALLDRIDLDSIVMPDDQEMNLVITQSHKAIAKARGE